MKPTRPHHPKPSAPKLPGRKPPESPPPPARAHPAEAPRGRRHRREGGGRSQGGILFGLHAVAAAWLNPERRIRRLAATDAGLAALAPALAEAKAAGLARPEPTPAERAEIDRLVPPGAVHQGLALDAEPLPEVDIEDIVRLAAGREAARLIVLDQVTDPHNVGAILRSASAFGALAVVVTEHHAPEVTGTLAKSASGALESVPLVRVTNLARAIGTLQEGGFWCVGLDEAGSRTLAAMNLAGRVALVMGAEGTGLRRLTAERCDEIARLPTSGPVASLNVSNAAAVALYELVRSGA